ncbi:MAG TPA: trigger factor [Bacillota bacterium]|nr:trigger factor [Bacillota bacterium]HQC49322.1 trigger factor [Bacillota bacterium]
MTSQKVQEENRTIKFAVEVPADEFKKFLQAAHRKLAKHFQVPGFRKGKVPYPIVVNHYGESVLYDDALEEALPKVYEELLAQHEIEPYSDPRFNIREIGGNVGLKLDISVALKPVIELGEYEGLEAYRPPIEIEDEEIDKEIEAARTRVARLVPIGDRAIQEGDHVTIDYKGLKDDVPFDGGTAEGHKLEIGSGSFIPGFEEGLVGRKVGDTLDLPLTFPEEYHAEDLAGEDVVFSVTIHEALEREIPELNDDFVRDVSEKSDTVEEYREEIREQLEKKKADEADRVYDDGIIGAIVQSSKVELSDLMVDDEVESRIEQQQKQFSMYGINFMDFLRYSGQTIEDYKNSQSTSVRRMLEGSWVLNAVREREQERIEVTDEEFEESVREAAESAGITEELFEEQYLKTDYDRDRFRHELEMKKLLSWLREISVATDVEPEPNEEPEDAEELAEEEEGNDLA